MIFFQFINKVSDNIIATKDGGPIKKASKPERRQMEETNKIGNNFRVNRRRQ